MTMEAVKASHFDDEDVENGRPWTISGNVSMVYIGNSMHVVQPITHEETSMLDDTSKSLIIIIIII